MAHKSEIEAKRAKLEELRRKRAAISTSTSTSADTTSTSDNNNIGQNISSYSNRESIDTIVNSIVGLDILRSVNDDVENTPENGNENENQEADAKYASKVFPIFDFSPQPQPSIVSYSKEVQTDEWIPETEASGIALPRDVDASFALNPETSKETDGDETGTNEEENEPASFLENEETQLEQKFMRLDTQAEEEKGVLLDKNTEQNEPNDTELTEQANSGSEKSHVESYSFLDDSDIYSSSSVEQNYTQLAQFKSEEVSGRAVTSLDWSPRYPELLAASYTESSASSRAPKGLVCIWNIRAPSSPEFVLTAPSNILAVKFSQFNNKIVFGAAYNGQLFSWNLKTGSKPVLSTPVTGIGHNHPIFSLQHIGTQHANTLFSVSTDGTFCTWAPDIFSSPLEQLPLSTDSKEVSPTCMAVSPKDHTQFLVGTEEGPIYQGNRFSHAGTKAGLDSRGFYKGHLAPVSSLDIHPTTGIIDLSDYVLSAGFDWSINIWKYHEWGSIDTTHNYTEPLLSIPRTDVVYDVAWNHFVPNIFASVDGTGHLEIWNLLKDTDSPVLQIRPAYDTVNSDTPDHTSVIHDQNYLSRPLNKLCWDTTQDSRRIAVGGLDGLVTIIELSPKVIPRPTPEDWRALRSMLNRLD